MGSKLDAVKRSLEKLSNEKNWVDRKKGVLSVSFIKRGWDISIYYLIAAILY